MSTETLKNNTNKDTSINKVNINVLKNRVIEEQRRKKFQNRILLSSVLVTIGLIGYFVG